MKFLYPTPAHLPEVENQLREAVIRLYSRARRVLGNQVEATISSATSYYVSALQMDGALSDEDARAAAMEIADALIDCPDFAWWATPLGRACAWWIGYNEDHAPREVVAGVLGVSKQRVFVMVRQKIDAGGNQTFTPMELRELLRRRWLQMEEAKAA